MTLIGVVRGHPCFQILGGNYLVSYHQCDVSYKFFVDFFFKIKLRQFASVPIC